MSSTSVASCNPCIQVYTTKKIAKGEIMCPLWGGTIYVEPYSIGHGAGIKMSIEGYPHFSAFDLKHLIDRLSEIHEVLVQ